MKNIKLVIEYEGTNYSGWQNQDDVVTVQETIEKAIYKATGESAKLVGSGRTDKGVHSLGQVANFLTNSTIPGYKFKTVLNNLLPGDVAIIKSEEANIGFHARFDAVKKRYMYRIYNGKTPRPLYRRFSCQYKHNLDIEKMREASKYLLGTHDFRSFMGKKTDVHTTVRTIYKIDIEREGDFILLTFEGDSFLKHMIRIIVGTLTKIGNGQIPVEKIKTIIESKDRGLAGKTAPPEGLFLLKVFYGVKKSS